MTGRLRRTLGRVGWRVRHAVGYWWLEQADGFRGRQRRGGRWSTRLRASGTAVADGWFALTHGTTARAHRLWRAVRGVGPGRSYRPALARPRPAWRPHRSVGDAVAGWFAAVGDGTGDVLATLGGLGTRTQAGLGRVGAGTTPDLRSVSSGAARGTPSVGSALTGGIRSVRTRTRDLGGSRRASGAAKAAALLLVLVLSIAVRLQLTDDGGGRQSGMPASQVTGPAGPGFTEPGIHLSASPLASGDLEVVERIMLPRPVSTLPLSAPPPPPASAGPAARLVDLHVAVDNQAIPLTTSIEVEKVYDLELPRPATAVELHYRVENAAARSPAAPARRATLSLRPATSGALTSQPTVVAVRGAEVHTLMCLDESRTHQLCGISAEDGWRTRPLTATRSSVLALVDLPPT